MLAAGAVLLATSALLLLVWQQPATELRGLLQRWQFWVLEAHFLLLLATTVRAIPHLSRALPSRRQVLASAAASALLAWALTTWVAPRSSRIYYDEQIYQGIGQNLADLHLAQMCNDGTVEYGRLECRRGEYNKQPYGYPYLLALVDRVAGTSEHNAFRLNTLVNGATAGVAVLLSALLFRAPFAAGMSGLVFALLPMQITWSNTAASEPSAAFACAVAALAVVLFVRDRGWPTLAWLVTAASFASTFRPESVLVVPLVVFALMMLAHEELSKPRLWWAALGGLALFAVTIVHAAAVRDEGWGAAGSRLAFFHAAGNLSVNLPFYFGDERFPVLFGIAALAAVCLPGQRREKMWLAGFFLLFWGVFLFFYAGSYNFGADVRYSLMSHVPGALLAAWAIGWGTDRARAVCGRWAPTLAVAAVCFQFLWYLPLVRATGEEAWAARADVEFAAEFARTLPHNAIVLTHNPSIFHVRGVNAAQMSLAQTERSYVRDSLFPRYAGGVYLHWNFWCNVGDPKQVNFCRDALEAFPHTPIEQRKVRDYAYTFYRLHKE